jgi:hypothetical protein
LPDDAVAQIAEALRRLPQSVSDRSVGNFLIREIAGFDVVWIVGREAGEVVLTIGRIRPPDPGNPTEEVLHKLNVAAMIRGLTGL